jgi:hypothetical protein
MSTHTLHDRNPDELPVSWQDLLNTARNEYEVVAIARDFVATFEPKEMARLPEACRPGKFFEGDDITAFAFAVMRHQGGDDTKTAQLVSRVATFFSNASDRLTQILATSSNGERRDPA